MARADSNGPFKEFAFEDWLCEGFESLKEEMNEAKSHFSASNFKKHLRNASKEQLLAMRSLIDDAIEYLDKQTEKTQKA